MNYQQNKIDFCCFCGDILGLRPQLVAHESGAFHYKIACTECRKKMQGQWVMQMNKAAAFLQGKDEPEFVQLLPAAECRDVELEEKGIEPYRAFLLSAKMRNLGLVSIGQKAVSVRRCRADLEKAIAIRHWKFASFAKA